MKPIIETIPAHRLVVIAGGGRRTGSKPSKPQDPRLTNAASDEILRRKLTGEWAERKAA